MEKIILLHAAFKSKHLILGLNYKPNSITINKVSLFDEHVHIFIKYDKSNKKYRMILLKQSLVYLPRDYSLQSNNFKDLIRDFRKETETIYFMNFFGYSKALKIRKQIQAYLCKET